MSSLIKSSLIKSDNIRSVHLSSENPAELKTKQGLSMLLVVLCKANMHSPSFKLVSETLSLN